MASANDVASDTKAQIAQLRKQVESLMGDRVTPYVNDAAERASSAARQATDYTRDQAESVADQVRDRPLIAIAVAALVGYVLGRFVR